MGRKTSNSVGIASQVKKGEQYLRICNAFMDSAAYRVLSGTETRLLQLALRRDIAARLHAQRGGECDPLRFPTDKWELLQELYKGKGLFFLNLGLVCAARLYKVSNRNTFYDDRKRLVALGFLEEITPRKEFYPRGERVKDVYALSGQWRNVSEQEAENCFIVTESPTKRSRNHLQNGSE